MTNHPLSLFCKYYDTDSIGYKILIDHSRSVAEYAEEIINKHPELGADRQLVIEGAWLHDIGIFHTNAPSIGCFGPHPYITHSYKGAELLRREGLARHALIAERHTGAGISLKEIIERDLPIPHQDMIPISIEEKIVCFADKFYSKANLGKRYSLETAIEKLKKHEQEGVERFINWSKLFM